MEKQLGMAVANVLYPSAPAPDQNNADALWNIIADKEKVLCLKIARAVLSEIRTPSKQMLAAAETDIATLLEQLDDRMKTNPGSVDIVATAFTAMIDEAVRQTGQTEEPVHR